MTVAVEENETEEVFVGDLAFGLVKEVFDLIVEVITCSVLDRLVLGLPEVPEPFSFEDKCFLCLFIIFSNLKLFSSITASHAVFDAIISASFLSLCIGILP